MEKVFGSFFHKNKIEVWLNTNKSAVVISKNMLVTILVVECTDAFTS